MSCFDTSSATGVFLQARNPSGSVVADSATLSTLDAWTRLDVSVTPAASETWTFQVRQNGAGNTDGYFSAVLVEESSSLGPYYAGTTTNLGGMAAPVGGPWDTTHANGDFEIDTASHIVQRDVTTDGSLLDGRHALAGTATFTTVAVQVDAKSETLNGSTLGVEARHVDPDNFFAAWFDGVAVRVYKRVAGTATLLASPTAPGELDAWFTVTLLARDDGGWAAWMRTRGAAAGAPVAQGHDSDLASGGPLEDGRVGFYDSQAFSNDDTRSYKNFAAWVPSFDAVIHANRSAEIGTEGAFRETADGTGWGPTPPPLGDLPRIPTSGLEGRPVEVCLLTSLGDLDLMPDTGGGTIGARVHYQPSWLQVPGA